MRKMNPFASFRPYSCNLSLSLSRISVCVTTNESNLEKERLVHIEQPPSKKGEGKAQIAEKFDGKQSESAEESAEENKEMEEAEKERREKICLGEGEGEGGKKHNRR